MKERRLTPTEKAAFYAELEKKHPERRHTLSDRPPAPLPLLPCRCGCTASPRFLYALYGLPCYRVECEHCGAASIPEPWGVLLLYAEESPHMVTEPDALRRACDTWNRQQIRAAAEQAQQQRTEPQKAGCNA